MVERYSPLHENWGRIPMEPDATGDWVCHSDYAALERQIAELRAKVDVQRQSKEYAQRCCEKAEAENARLRALPLKDERHLTPDEQKTFNDALRKSGTIRQVLPLKDEMERVLEPFADIAGEAWADENGWTVAACPNDRIRDWFGPSAFRAARALLSRLRAGEQEGSAPTHRHKKRGSEYVLLGYGKMQAENWRERSGGGLLTDIDTREVAIYRGVDDGSLWVRPREEFEDGRFEPLPASPSVSEGGSRNG